MKKILLNIAKGIGLTLAAILLLMFLWPILFPGSAEEQIKRWTNENIEGRLEFSAARLSFFEHFPALTLTLRDFSLTGSAPFQEDTLLSGASISFGLDIGSIFRETLEVNAFYVDQARINVQVDKQGNANYNIYKGGGETESDSSETRLKINGIYFEKCHLTYHDRSVPMLIEAKDFYYEGRGDLASSQFDLQSNMRAASFDFVYDGTAYFLNRKLQAELVTGINTASLVFRFAKNNLLINRLPVDFSGEMAILRDGYDIDLNVVSGTTDFGNIFSALPPEYDQWFADTKFSGRSQISVALKGLYRAATGDAPDLSLRLWVHDGSIRHKGAPAPLQHLWVNSSIHIPKLQTDSLALAIDTLQFDLNGAPTRIDCYVKGLDQPYVRADLNTQLDLALLDSAIGLSAADLRGRLDLRLHADGYYRSSVRQKETVVTGVPAYRLDGALQDGFFHDKAFELPLRDLAAVFHSECKSGKWQDIAFSLDTIHAALGEGNIAGRVAVERLENSKINALLRARLRLDDIARAVPFDAYVLKGELNADLKADGRLNAGRKLFPVVEGAVQWQNGLLQTPYYPKPIENINLNASLHGRSGGYRDLLLRIEPLSFSFEQQPFALRAELQNPSDWRYKLSANGTLDLGRIYQVFAVSGYGISGLLRANLEVQGSEADARAGRYDRIKQKGDLQLKNVELRSDDYPDPFFVPACTLKFDQDKAWLSDALLRYRKNEFLLNGYAQNFIGHALSGSPLYGELSVRSSRLLIDDFTALAGPATTAAAKQVAQQAPATGVVLLPNDMELSLKASVAEIAYGQTTLRDFTGQLDLKKGELLLRETKFEIAGAKFGLEGSYSPVNARKARFTFSAKADSFDVQRAYHEIPMFREMASSAEKASGLISLQYSLEGRLNDRMEPVYPSIKGKGVLKLEQVKVKGLKLFGAVSKATSKDEINDPDLKAVVMRSSVANNLITIERTKMKVLGFRPRIEGQCSLDGRLNLRFRLGLPPFGLIGIPMTITGTSEEPVVEVRKGKDGDQLEEERDEEAGEEIDEEGQ
ncbi:MAG: hypothetical protein H6575_15110 [Lewinellaceae bacterium]|nr:hypothetical protein [Lewinellaceae bacterium]